jgi:polyhydroxybutyrate depolymerase
MSPVPLPTRLTALVASLCVLAACSSATHTASGSTTTTTVVPTSVASTTISPTTTLPPATKPLAAQSAAYVFTLTSGGRTRDYRLHVPPAAAGGAELPLVLNLHGATQNGQIQELQTGMDASADKHGYLVAYPDGTRIATNLTPDPIAKDAQYGFNAGYCCGLPSTNHLDDVDFLLAVISNVASHTPVDLRRVYVTGMSNGGMMAYAMAAEASSHIAAIASVAGQVELPAIHPTRPVPTLEFHSVDDPIAKWDGVASSNPQLRFTVTQGIDQWVKADGCAATPHTGTTIAGTGTSAGLSATLVTYPGCRAGSEVALWRLTGSGHVWPGAPFNTGPRNTWILDGVGRGTTLIDANELMWQFFQHYSLPAAP